MFVVEDGTILHWIRVASRKLRTSTSELQRDKQLDIRTSTNKMENSNTPNNTGFRDIYQATHYTNEKKMTLQHYPSSALDSKFVVVKKK